jgi:hypothetical protein
MSKHRITLYHADGRTKLAFPDAAVLERHAAAGFRVAVTKAPAPQTVEAPAPQTVEAPAPQTVEAPAPQTVELKRQTPKMPEAKATKADLLALAIESGIRGAQEMTKLQLLAAFADRT